MKTAATSFVGRVDECAAVQSLLAEPSIRIVTLLGPPGVGKTRLAVRAAEAVASVFGDVVSVSLADVRHPARVASTIAAAVGVAEVGRRSALELLVEHLGADSRLLLLDNVEQVIEAADDLAHLVTECPRLTLLVTSRRPLQLSVEYCFPVAPLPVPPPSASLDQIRCTDAALLLTDRLKQVRPELAVDDPTMLILADICRALDGLPLALELAAARARALPIAAVRDAIVQRVAVLTGGPRDQPGRQRTMHTAIAWSYEMLEPTAASVFRRLGVCVGGADLDALAALTADVIADASTLLDLIGELVSQSLVVAVEAPDPRFRFLEVVREFALEALTTSGEAATTRARHAAHYLGVAEAAARHFSGPEQVQWLDRVGRDAANFTSAVRFAVDAGDVDTALRLCLSLRLLWYVRGPIPEGRALFAAALALPGASEGLRGPALIEAAALARHHGDLDAALTLLDEAVPLARACADPDLLAGALLQHGFVLHLRGEFDRARDSLEEALTLRQAARNELGTALALHHLGLVAYFDDADVGLAWELQSRCLALLRRTGNERHLATGLIAMGELARSRGELGLARELLAEALAHIRRLQDTPLLIYALHYVANTSFDEGHVNLSLRLIGAAEGLEHATGAVAWPAVIQLRDRWLPRAIGSVGQRRAALLRDHGRRLGFDEVVTLAAADPAWPTVGPLTRRELEVAELVAEGLTNRVIAERLVVSERTVEAHVAHVLAKLGIDNRAQIVNWVATG